MNPANKHEFAIYIPLADHHQVNTILIMHDKLVYHRIINVLRYAINDILIIFNQRQILTCKIIDIDKKNITFIVIAANTNTELKPKITALIGLLKKEAFEEALYSCVELGVNSIYPVITQKTHQKNISEKEMARYHNILIAAAEQSKHFHIPPLHKPVELQKLITDMRTITNAHKIYFDAQGEKLATVIQTITQQPTDQLFLLIGPEGDLSPDEKNLIKSAGFTLCTLTPTILRAQTAVTLGLGIFRSIP